MTKGLLESITRLFALSANKKLGYDEILYLRVYKDFLNAKVEQKYHDEYIAIFLEKTDLLSSSKSLKALSSNSVRLISVCEKMKKNLSEKDRFEIVFYLIMLIKSLGTDEQSVEFAFLVAELFEIDDKLLKLLYKNEDEDDLFNVSLSFENLKIASFYLSKYGFVIVKPLREKLSLDGEKLNPNEIYLFKKDSVLVYDNYRKYFFPELESFAQAEKLNAENIFDLQISNLEVKIKGEILLHKLCLSFKSGEIVGVLGNSGSGKTTLLRAVYDIISGKKIGEGRSDSNKENLLCPFLEQSSCFVSGFSLNEILQRRANVLQIDESSRTQLIEELLDSFKLSEHRDKIVVSTKNNKSELSGGQIKRLAIATEMISNPDVLFLDEPTSGLSSYDSLNIITLLKKLALENKIVISSIHKPDFDVFMMFDKILLIDDFGYPIFYDSPLKVADYFRKYTQRVDHQTLFETNFNPSVIFDIVGEKYFDDKGKETNKRKVEPNEWYQLFLENCSEKKMPNLELKRAKSQKLNLNIFKLLWSNFKFLSKIELRSKLRLLFLILVPLIFGFVFSYLLRYTENTEDYQLFYNPNFPIWGFILLTCALFIGIVDSGHEFILFKKFYKSESELIKSHDSNLLISRCLKYLFLSFFQALLLVVPAIFIIEAEFHFVNLLSIIWLLIFWGNMMGILLSILFSNIILVYLFVPLILIPQLVFSGVLINFSNFNSIIQKDNKIPYIADLMPLRWASEAMITDFYLNNPYEKQVRAYRSHLVSANYYLNYWIPFCKDSSEIKPDFVKKELENKLSYYDMLSQDNMTNDEMIMRLEKYFLGKKQYYTSLLDSISACSGFSSKKLRYSNLELDNIISNYMSFSPISSNDKNIIRKYRLIYISPDSFYSNRYFLTGLKKVNDRYISTYCFNMLILGIYTFLLIIFSLGFLGRKGFRYRE